MRLVHVKTGRVVRVRKQPLFASDAVFRAAKRTRLYGKWDAIEDGSVYRVRYDVRSDKHGGISVVPWSVPVKFRSAPADGGWRTDEGSER